jgi:peptidoglycan/LPS O-acetylase OafA/YrhL
VSLLSRPPEKTLGQSYHTSSNSFNFLRLIFASAVLVSHAAGMALFIQWTGAIKGFTAAEMGLYGFFIISGFLIMESAVRSGVPKFTWARILRIFPGLLVCLALIAFVAGYVYWHHVTPRAGGYGSYLHIHPSPWGYFWNNALLPSPIQSQMAIGRTPLAYPRDWNGPIWTLFYEFVCYFITLVVVKATAEWRRQVIVGITVCLWLFVVVASLTPWGAHTFSVFYLTRMEDMIRFSYLFLTAGCIYLYRDRIPDSGWLALVCGGGFLASAFLPYAHNRYPTFSFTPIDITLPLMAYAIIWLGLHLPLSRWGRRNDISYGIYIYGWPVTLFLLEWNFARWGALPFMLISWAITIPVAWASWWIVERPSLRLKRLVG